jgi:hypothetical protein
VAAQRGGGQGWRGWLVGGEVEARMLEVEDGGGRARLKTEATT